MAFRVRMKMKCMLGGKPGQEERGAGWGRVKCLKINAISNAQSDYIARGCQRCEDSDGFFVLTKPFILKTSHIYIQMVELARITPTTEHHPNLWRVRFGKSADWLVFGSNFWFKFILDNLFLYVQNQEAGLQYLRGAVTCRWVMAI